MLCSLPGALTLLANANANPIPIPAFPLRGDTVHTVYLRYPVSTDDDTFAAARSDAVPARGRSKDITRRARSHGEHLVDNDRRSAGVSARELFIHWMVIQVQCYSL